MGKKGCMPAAYGVVAIAILFVVILFIMTACGRESLDEVSETVEGKIRVYTLYDDFYLRILAAEFEEQYENVEVEIVYGLTGEDAVTVTDAIRTLNTELIGGEGPDIIVLDGLDMDVYVDNSMLYDVSEDVSALIDDVFSNIIRTYTEEDGSIYAMPICFKIPIIVGREDKLAYCNSASDMAALASSLAGDKTVQLMEAGDAITLFGSMMYVDALNWFDEDGSIIAGKLSDYLEAIKTIYDAVYAALDVADLESYEIYELWNQFYTTDNDVWNLSYFGDDPAYDAVHIMNNEYTLSFGLMGGSDSLDIIYSAMRADDTMTYKIFDIDGSSIYTPVYTMGINSQSENISLARAFLSYLTSASTQLKLAKGCAAYPVNRDAFYEYIFGDMDAEVLVETPYSSYDYENIYGKECDFDIYHLSLEEYEDFISLIESLNTASYSKNTVLNIILKECYGCVMGLESVESAVARTEAEVNLYLSE